MREEVLSLIWNVQESLDELHEYLETNRFMPMMYKVEVVQEVMCDFYNEVMVGAVVEDEEEGEG